MYLEVKIRSSENKCVHFQLVGKGDIFGADKLMNFDELCKISLSELYFQLVKVWVQS